MTGGLLLLGFSTFSGPKDFLCLLYESHEPLVHFLPDRIWHPAPPVQSLLTGLLYQNLPLIWMGPLISTVSFRLVFVGPVCCVCNVSVTVLLYPSSANLSTRPRVSSPCPTLIYKPSVTECLPLTLTSTATLVEPFLMCRSFLPSGRDSKFLQIVHHRPFPSSTVGSTGPSSPALSVLPYILNTGTL